MIHAQNTKIVQVTNPSTVSAGAATTATIDTNGFDYCSIIFIGGSMTGGYSVFKVQESDDSGMSGAVDISNDNGVLGFGETNQLNVDGTASTDPDATDDVTYGIEIDLRGRKRYLDVSATAGGNCVSCIFAILSRAGEIDADSLSDRGFTGLIRA